MLTKDTVRGSPLSYAVLEGLQIVLCGLDLFTMVKLGFVTEEALAEGLAMK